MNRGVVIIPKAPTTVESTSFSVVLATLYVLIASAYLLTAEGIFDTTGHVVGRDFINLWSAGTLSATGHLHDIFNHETYHRLQEQLFGRELPFHNWSYPPHMLLIAVPLAWLPYACALALWSLLTLGLYLLATRHRRHRLLLLAAPATFINLFFGQTGCLVAALLIGAFGMLERRPVLAGVLFGLASIKPSRTASFDRPSFGASMAHDGECRPDGRRDGRPERQIFGWEAWHAWLGETAPFQTRILEHGTGLFTLMMPSAFMGGDLSIGRPRRLLVASPFTLLAVGATYWAFRRGGGGGGGVAVAIFLLSTVIATPYIHSYDLTLISPCGPDHAPVRSVRRIQDPANGGSCSWCGSCRSW